MLPFIDHRKCLVLSFVLLITLVLSIISQLEGDVETYLMESYTGTKLNETNAKPHGVHISFGEDPTRSVIIVWSTAAYAKSKVLYRGKGGKLMNYEVAASVHRFQDTNDYGLQFQHRAIITRLEPNTTYIYQIFVGSISESKEFTFTTLPKYTNYSPFKPSFLVYGDFGLMSKGFKSIVSEALTGKYHAVLHLGDIAYNLFSMKGLVGDAFLKKIEPYAARYAYMTAVGDHEYPNRFIHYRNRFSMPGVPFPMPEEKLWYSTTVGNVHLISYSTEVFFRSKNNIERQFLWLLEDLHKAHKSRDKIPWIIVMGHYPLYCSQIHPIDCNSEKSLVRAGVEDLFYTFGVDLVLSGHCHSYERSYPMYKGKRLSKDYKNPVAPVFVTTGTTGNQYITDSIHAGPQNEWSAFLMSATEKESFGRLLVHNNSVLEWKEVLTSNKTVIDSFFLVKEGHGPNADVESFIRKARDKQNIEDLLVGQSLSVARGDLIGWRTCLLMSLAFVIVVLLIVFRSTIADVIETETHRLKFYLRKFYGHRKRKESMSSRNSILKKKRSSLPRIIWSGEQESPRVQKV